MRGIRPSSPAWGRRFATLARRRARPQRDSRRCVACASSRVPWRTFLPGRLTRKPRARKIRALVAIEAAPNDEQLYLASDRFERRLDPDLARMLARQRGSEGGGGAPLRATLILTPGEWANAVCSPRGATVRASFPLWRAPSQRRLRPMDALLQLFVRKDAVVDSTWSPRRCRPQCPAWRAEPPGMPHGSACGVRPKPNGAHLRGACARGRSRGHDLCFRHSRPELRAACRRNRLVGRCVPDAESSLVDEMPPKSPWVGVMTETERKVMRLRREQPEPSASERGEKPRAGRLVRSPQPAAQRRQERLQPEAMSGLPRQSAGYPAPRRLQALERKLLGLVAVQYYPDGLPQPSARSTTPPTRARSPRSRSPSSRSLRRRVSIGEASRRSTRMDPDDVGRDPKTDVLFVVARPDSSRRDGGSRRLPFGLPGDRTRCDASAVVEAPKLLSDGACLLRVLRAHEEGQSFSRPHLPYDASRCESSSRHPRSP